MSTYVSSRVWSAVWRSEEQQSRSWIKPSTSGGARGAEDGQRPQRAQDLFNQLPLGSMKAMTFIWPPQRVPSQWVNLIECA
jgi:hypothetical protein